jgi:predicted nuclease of predicted toxin-antitoxin system
MKILLDENIPAKVKFDFGPGYEVHTVRDMGWLGKKNGELMGLMTFNGFVFFITVDKNLAKQQNLTRYAIKIILLLARNNKHQTLQPLMPKVKELLKSGKAKNFNEITVN